MKSDLIQVDGKLYRKCKVTMLPVANPTDGQYINSCNKVQYISSLYFDYTKDQLRLSKNSSEMMTYIKDCCKPQHLYILSDEEIKVGDWYINMHNSVGNRSVQTHSQIRHLINHKKDWRFPQCKKIIATTDHKLGLTRPSDAFLKAYCEQGGIGEVLIELDDTFIDEEGTMAWGATYKLKVAPDNTITIKELKVKSSWNRDEVLALLNLALKFDRPDNYGYPSIEKSWNAAKLDWIEANL